MHTSKRIQLHLEEGDRLDVITEHPDYSVSFDNDQLIIHLPRGNSIILSIAITEDPIVTFAALYFSEGTKALVDWEDGALLTVEQKEALKVPLDYNTSLIIHD